MVTGYTIAYNTGMWGNIKIFVFLQTAMLLSLCGANCVCLNQWHTTSEDNAVKLQGIMASILEDGLMIGQAARKVVNPTLKKPEPLPEETPVTPSKS